MSSRTVPARGRKRFLHDLNNAARLAESHPEVEGLRLSSVSAGDEDGSIECVLDHTSGAPFATLTLLISETSEYPSDHTFFCSSQRDLPPQFTRILEGVHEDGAQPIEDIVRSLLEKIGKRVALSRRLEQNASQQDESDDAMDEDDGSEDYDIDDDHVDEDFGLVVSQASAADQVALQRDFNEIVAAGYRPGIIRFGFEDFAVSVSVPVISLLGSISAGALQAWDRRLLARSQHLSLLISGLHGSYPVLQADGTYNAVAERSGVHFEFRIGLTKEYKPSAEDVLATTRKFGLRQDDTPVMDVPQPQSYELPPDGYENPELEEMLEEAVEEEAEPEEVQDNFAPFSLSASLESLLNHYFLLILQHRLKYSLGWAGAEFLCLEAERSQRDPRDVIRQHRANIEAADRADAELSQSYNLPDPLLTHEEGRPLNIPLLAACYLLRRLTLCPRYCVVCHNKLTVDYEALKPYVCDSKLCAYQYYALNRGPSLEYEIRSHPETVDLLVSLAYIAAAEGTLDEPLPIGLGLRVKPRGPTTTGVRPGSDGLYEFDALPLAEQRSAIAVLIDSLPPVVEMKRWLEQPRRPGLGQPKLKDMSPSILPAAWLVLRWCIASCTAHLEELRSEDEQVKNISSEYRQFRFSVGAPDAEAKFRAAVQVAQQEDPNAIHYPSLFAFHGSPANNWHSIIRHGLWAKTVAHGRAYGNGVYFAKDGNYSISGYTRSAMTCWKNSAIRINSCVSLAEIVNHPTKFVSSNPFLVVANTEWIVCRYLLVKGGSVFNPKPTAPGHGDEEVAPVHIPFVRLDPRHPLTLSSKLIMIPDPTHALTKLINARHEEHVDFDYDADDMKIFQDAPPPSRDPDVVEVPPPIANIARPDDWQHDPYWVDQCVEYLLPPPTDSTPGATTALQKELKAVLKEQRAAKSLREQGWYLPMDRIGDNLYQWIVELHSFDPQLPIAQDLKRCRVNSLVFEIRFPATFPHSPPFFRILKPRFLPFIQGGGGHVTGGGSMCMDLLTADGWLPSYSISAILLQIKLAISNLDPRPARLDAKWDVPYGMGEALEGYKRAAATHGWRVPQGLDRLVR